MESKAIALDERIRAAAGQVVAQVAAQVSRGLAQGSLVASVRLGQSRDAVLMAALADRLLAEPGLSALIVAPSDKEVGGLKGAFEAVGGRLGLSSSAMGRYGLAEAARVSIGSMDAVASRASAGTLDADDFGIVALSDLGAAMGAADAALLRRALGPARPERRLLAFSAEMAPSQRALAREIGGDFAELELEAEGAKALAAPMRTYEVESSDKLPLFLGLLAERPPRPLAVFCSSPGVAGDVAAALRAKGLRADRPIARGRGDSRRSPAADGVTVLCDADMADGLSVRAAFLVNWDLPLEAEPYAARLACLDADSPGAGVVNFSCERFRFGLPVIERALGLSLVAERPAARLFHREAAPASEAPSGETNGRPRQPPRKDAKRREEGAQPKGQRRPGAAEGRPNARGPGARRGEDTPYDGKNIRSIQNDIASITGAAPPSPSRKAPSAASKRSSPKAAASKGSRGADRSGRPEERSGRGEPRQATEQRRRPRGGDARRIQDPYALPMEERLRLYRERYAGGSAPVSGEASPAASPKASPQASPKAKPAGSQASPRRKGSGRPELSGRPESSGIQPKGEPRNQGARNAGEPSGERDPKKGLLGVLRGLFGKNDS